MGLPGDRVEPPFAIDALEGVGATIFESKAGPGVGTVGSWIVGYLRHDAQHVGMVQTLRSVQGASQPAGMR